MYRLKQEKDNWFLARTARSAKNEMITRFLQLCVFPRCTFTQIDAVYCAKFVLTIHMLKTPNFSTLLCYDRLFCDITYSITSCTENEAMRYGRFLYAMLETVMRWHKSRDIFEKECAHYPGFVTKCRMNNQNSDNLDNVDYENYRHVCHKWHYKLAKAMVTCLESKDYVQIRNALIILIKIIPFFPVLIKLGQFIDKRIEKVRDEEKNNRQDLFTLSSSYLGLLKQRMTSGQMMKECDFHIPVGDRTKNEAKNQDESSVKQNGDAKDVQKDKEKKTKADDKAANKNQNIEQNTTPSKEKNEKRDKDEPKEKHRKEDSFEKEREKEKRRERKEEKASSKEERQDRQYRDERYIEMIPLKDDVRYSSERQMDRYYEDRRSNEYFREVREDRDLLSGNGNMSRQSQEPEPDREAKRRKTDGSSSKSSKHEERKQQQQQGEYVSEKVGKKERSVKAKEKREKLSDEEKELRKERKLGRKRDRAEENQQAELKRRREEDKANKAASNLNGEMLEPTSIPVREKHHRSREISPYGRERSHERIDTRDKHRRSSENKRR